MGNCKLKSTIDATESRWIKHIQDLIKPGCGLKRNTRKAVSWMSQQQGPPFLSTPPHPKCSDSSLEVLSFGKVTIETCRLYPTKLMNDDAICQWFISEVPWPGRQKIKSECLILSIFNVSRLKSQDRINPQNSLEIHRNLGSPFWLLESSLLLHKIFTQLLNPFHIFSLWHPKFHVWKPISII